MLELAELGGVSAEEIAAARGRIAPERRRLDAAATLESLISRDVLLSA